MKDKINYIYNLFSGMDISRNEINRHGEEKCHIAISSAGLGVNFIQFEIINGKDEIICALASTPAQRIPHQTGKLTSNSLEFGSINIKQWEDLNNLL